GVLDPLTQGGDDLDGAAGTGAEDHQRQSRGVERDAAELTHGDQRVIFAGVERRWRSRERNLSHLVHGEALWVVHAPEPRPGMHGIVVGDETIRVERSIEPQTSKQERTTAKHGVRRATPMPNLAAREGRENARRSRSWDDFFNARSSTFECQRRDNGAHAML